MKTIKTFWKNMSIGNKLATSAFLMIGILFAGMAFTVGISLQGTLEYRMSRDVMRRIEVIVSLLKAADSELRDRATAMANSLNKEIGSKVETNPSELVLSGAERVATIKSGDVVFNNNFDLIDKFSSASNGVATIFVRNGDDFVRVTTSVKNEKGERAVGTKLDRNGAAYKTIMEGKPYIGLADLFGRRFMTRYDPIKEAGGKIVGVRFIGVDFSDNLAQIKSSIRDLKILKSGYYFAMDAKPGATYGTMLVHPSLEGQNALTLKDAKGKFFIKEMLEQKNGATHYPWVDADKGTSNVRDKIAVFSHFKEWDWVIAGGTYSDEYLLEANKMRDQFAMVAAGVWVLLTALLWLFIRYLVSKPLSIAVTSAQKIAQGDLTSRIDVERSDEVGRIFKAINHIGEGISNLITGVISNASSIASASEEIGAANANLSKRTENQASALVETSASAEQLGATARENATNAQRANAMARDASKVAVQAGEAVGSVVQTMNGISNSSNKIVDIVKLIQNIAFQTNILALNAAVEAARAGDQGKGFAVVAAEVRSLAQRSDAAAKEISELINSSVGEIHNGSDQANMAGNTMHEVVEAINRVTSIMNEISVASTEQDSGVTQVRDAVAQMDTATQQNAALVEQMSTASMHLDQQAKELAQAVSAFKI